VKNTRCDSGHCKECSGQAGCWHGIEKTALEILHIGDLSLKVAAGSNFTNYDSEAWARCTTRGKWLVNLHTLTNGNLSIFLEQKLIASRTEISQTNSGENSIQLDVQKSGNTRILISFSPTDHSNPSSAEVNMQALGVDPSAESCMDVKDCLGELSDGSREASELRNKNKRQLQCLDEDTASMSPELKTMCQKWNACVVAEDTKVSLRHFLRAVLLKGGVLMEDVDGGSQRQMVDPHTCIQPDIDDPESWDCECLPIMEKRCEEEVQFQDLSIEECLRMQICEHAQVCTSWKASHCDQPSQSLMIRRAVASSNISEETGLDDAVQGKCSQ